MVSSALGSALGLTAESTLEELKDGIVGVINRGALNFNPSSSTSQSVEIGYYTGGTMSSSNAYNAGINEGMSKVKMCRYSGSITCYHGSGRPASDYTKNISISHGTGYSKYLLLGAASYYDYSSFSATSLRVSGCSVIQEKRFQNDGYYAWLSGNISPSSSSTNVVLTGGDAGYYGTTYNVAIAMIVY